MTDPRADDAARLTEAVARATSPDAATVPPVPQPHRLHPEHLATQVRYPTRAAIRAGLATVVAVEAALAAAAVPLGPFVDKYIPGAGATVIAFGVFCGGLATVTNRIANLPKVASLLTLIGLGPIPKQPKS